MKKASFIISTPHAGVDPFSNSKDKSRHSTSMMSAKFYSICKRLLSENILEVLDTLDQHQLQSKK